MSGYMHRLVVGKSDDHVCPVTYALPLLSTAMPWPFSCEVPPRYVEYINAEPDGFSFVTNAS